MAKTDRQLFDTYGTQWARNTENLQALKRLGTLHGVYVLCDGSMPVYVGRGKLAKRIAGHKQSRRKGQFWDHFSWYGMPSRDLEADVEALLLRMLPFYLRSLNKQRTRFSDAKRIKQVKPEADPITRPNFGPARRRRS